MTELYILSPEDRLLAVLTEETGLIHTLLREELNRMPASPFRFTIEAGVEQAQYVKEENQVAFRDKEGDLRLFVIKEVDDVDNRNGPETTVACEPACMELKEYVVVDKHMVNESVDVALDAALEGTRWTGEVEVQLGNATTTFHYMSSIDAIWEILAMWGGEVKDVVEFDERNHITVRKILLKQRLGADNGIRFEIDHNTVEIQRTVLSYPVTALYGRGDSLQAEGEETTQYMDFADIEWTVANGDPVDKPLGQRWIGDPEALQKYGREHEGQWMHRYGIWQNQNIEEPEELLQATWEQLPKVSQPEVHYKLSIDLLDEAIRLGDTARAIDRQFTRPIEIQTRVIAMEYDVLDPTNTAMVEMGQFLHAHDPDDRIDRVMEEIDRNRGKWESDSKPITNDRYPDIKPDTPVNLSAEGGFQVNQLYWDYTHEVYVNYYEVYGSQLEGFVPESQHLLWRGKVSAFAHQVETDEVWYYRVRAVNTHGTPSDYSAQLSSSTVRVISEDILWGEELAEQMRELHRISDIIGENGISYDQISEFAKNLLHLEAREYTDEEIQIIEQELYEQLADKAGIDYVEGQLQLKADQATVDDQISAVQQELAEKAELEYVDGQLISKVNVGDVYTIEDVDNKFGKVVSVTQYTTDMDGVVSELNSQDSRMSQAENQIEMKVNETTYEEGLADAKRYGSELIINPNETTLFHFDNHLRSTSGVEPVNSVATLRPGEGKFSGAVAVEEGTTNLFYENMLGSMSGLNIGDSTIISNRELTRLGENQYKIEWLQDLTGTQNMILSSALFSSNRREVTWSVVVDEFQYGEGSNANLGFGWNSHGNPSLRIDNGLGYKSMSLGEHPDHSGNTNRVSLRTGSTSALITAGTYVIFSNLQVEEKNFATSFVNGIRGESGILEYSAPATRSTQFTLSGYFKVDLSRNNYMTSLFASGSGADDFYLRVYGSGGARPRQLRVRLGNVFNAWLSSNLLMHDNVWYHIGLTWDHGEIKVFFDGEEVYSNNVSQNTIDLTGNNLVIGTRADYPTRTDSVMNGMVDQLRIDSITRTAEEIKRWYELQKPFVDSESTDTYRQVTETQASVNVLAGRVELMASKDDLVSVENDLSEVTSQVGSLTVSYDGLSGTVANTELLVDDLTGEVSSAVSQIGNLELRADGFNVSIGELGSKIAEEEIYRVVARGHNSDYIVGSGIWDREGNRIWTGSNNGRRSWNLNIYDRNSQIWDSHETYDLYNDSIGNDERVRLTQDLEALGTNKLIVLIGEHAPTRRRLDGSLPDQIYRCGGSRDVLVEKNWSTNHPVYILVGIPGMGEGNGNELFAAGNISFLDTNFSIYKGNVKFYKTHGNPSTSIAQANTAIDQNANAIALRAQEINVIDGRMSQAETSLSVMSDEIALKVDRDGLVSSINLQPEGVQIKGVLIHLSGLSVIDDGIIQNAHIANLSAEKVTVGTMLGDRIQANTLNGNRIVAGTINADRLNVANLSAVTSNMGTLTAGILQSNNNRLNFNLNNGILEIRSGGQINFMDSGNGVKYVTGSHASGMIMSTTSGQNLPMTAIGVDTGTGVINANSNDFSGIRIHSRDSGSMMHFIRGRYLFATRADLSTAGFAMNTDGNEGTRSIYPWNSSSYSYDLGRNSAQYNAVYTRNIMASEDVHIRDAYSSGGWLFTTRADSGSTVITMRGINTGSWNYNLGATGWRLNRIFLSNSPDISSDERLKEEIVPNTLGLAFINDLDTNMFRLKQRSSDTEQNPLQIGIIAQQLKSTLELHGVDIASHSILSQSDEGYFGVQYEQLLAPTIKGLQELSSYTKDQFNTMSLELQYLKMRVKQLEENAA